MAEIVLINEAKEACNILMELNRMLVIPGKQQEINVDAINAARNAAKIVNKTGYYNFSEDNTSITDFFHEVQNFANHFRNLKK